MRTVKKAPAPGAPGRDTALAKNWAKKTGISFYEAWGGTPAAGQRRAPLLDSMARLQAQWLKHQGQATSPTPTPLQLHP